MAETQLAELPLGAADESLWKLTFPSTPANGNSAAVWEKNLRTAAKKLSAKKFLGVVLSAPGIVDEARNKVVFSPNVHWTEAADLPAMVGRIFSSPVLVVQEERVMALGHHLNHPADEDFLLVDFGAGVGGAAIVGGKPFVSPLPLNGELGHTPAIGNHRRCGCGAVGCVETLISRRGLLESFSAAHPKQKKDWATLQNFISANGIEPWLAQSLDAAAVAIAGALNVLGLRRVIVTGSLTELSASVLAHLSRAVQDGAMWARFGKVECSGAPRARAAGLVAIGVDRLVVPDLSN